VKQIEGKNVLLCVGGGIAAYKTPDIVRKLMAEGAVVQVAMTAASSRFITALTLQAVSRRPVATNLLDAVEEHQIGHIRLAADADVVLVAPATANLIARMAHGMGDDIVTASLLATRAPVVVAPAMNTLMLEHPAVRANLERLESFGHRIVAPDSGELACGYEGAGRLPDAEDLIEEVATALSEQDLAGQRLLVSAGPTCEPLDPVRHLTNRSSGKMGYAVARAARRRGAAVTIVSGPTALATPRGCSRVDVVTAAEMNEAMRDKVTASDVVVMVAAVADYRPATKAESKIKKHDASLTLALERTEDILAGLSGSRGDRVLVGFAAETDDVLENAAAKMKRKNLDMIVANDVSRPDSGFDVSHNSAVIIDSQGRRTSSGLVEKDDLAETILDKVVSLIAEKRRAANSA
jgi:phosphopantothenoylcysteine decarboxylase/phosphopantothenate--cysteine ligase